MPLHRAVARSGIIFKRLISFIVLRRIVVIERFKETERPISYKRLGGGL